MTQKDITQNDISKALAEAFETIRPRHAPDELLTSVFSVTRATRQRSGLTGRLGSIVDSFRATFQTSAIRPVVSFAVLIALLALLLVSAVFIGGRLWERHATGWRVLAPEPAPGEYVSVMSIVNTPTGFVAVGSAEKPIPGACRNDQNRGRVWTSRDGDEWVETAQDSLVGMRPEGLLASGDALYLFGRTDLCAQDEPAPARVWRSTDATTWELLPASEPFNLGNIPTIVDVDGTFVATGTYQEPPSAANPEFYGEPEWRVWISTNAVNWEQVFSDRDSYLGGLATNGESLVALVSRVNEPVTRLSISHDLGRTWREAETEPFVTNSLFALAAGNGGYVAVGQNIALSSTDGETWTSTATDFGGGLVMSPLWALPDGFLATGVRSDGASAIECPVGQARPSIQVLPTFEPAASVEDSPAPQATVPAETCSPVPGSGGTWLSADGIDWKRGPDLPQQTIEADFATYMLAAGHDALVASFRPVDAGEASLSTRIWYEPLSDFRP